VSDFESKISYIKELGRRFYMLPRKPKWWWTRTKEDLWMKTIDAFAYEWLYEYELLKQAPEPMSEIQREWFEEFRAGLVNFIKEKRRFDRVG
jgi:hypothetical protein